MTLSSFRHTLQLRNTFTLATSSRTTTPCLIVQLDRDGITGYGEASMPPYLGETYETAELFLTKVNLNSFHDLNQIDTIMTTIDSLAQGNYAIKAAIDIAIHDWVGKASGYSWHRMWGLSPKNAPCTSFTIGIDSPSIVQKKVRDASQYCVLKIKLGSANDKEIIQAIREVTDVPLRVDCNEGWNNKETALEMINWLSDYNVQFVEQPMPKELLNDCKWVRERSPLPIIADESVVRIGDIENIKSAFDGINIKLMKCTGMTEAYKMITLARSLDMLVMLGCMTETSCAISAAAQLSPLVDWADLDGAALISNDIFDGVKITECGKISLLDRPGIGVTPLF